MAVVAFIMSWHEERDGHGAAGGRGRLAGFRRELYLSLGMRRDVLFEAWPAEPRLLERLLSGPFRKSTGISTAR